MDRAQAELPRLCRRQPPGTARIRNGVVVRKWYRIIGDVSASSGRVAPAYDELLHLYMHLACIFWSCVRSLLPLPLASTSKVSSLGTSSTAYSILLRLCRL